MRLRLTIGLFALTGLASACGGALPGAAGPGGKADVLGRGLPMTLSFALDPGKSWPIIIPLHEDARYKSEDIVVSLTAHGPGIFVEDGGLESELEPDVVSRMRYTPRIKPPDPQRCRHIETYERPGYYDTPDPCYAELRVNVANRGEAKTAIDVRVEQKRERGEQAPI